jgi:hypothetical protein
MLPRELQYQVPFVQKERVWVDQKPFGSECYIFSESARNLVPIFGFEKVKLSTERLCRSCGFGPGYAP